MEPEDTSAYLTPQPAPADTNPPVIPVPNAAPVQQPVQDAPQPVIIPAQSTDGKPVVSTIKNIPSYDGLLDLLFRIGFGSVFLINSFVALEQPASFLPLLEDNFIARSIGHFNLQLKFIAANDLLLGILLLLGIKKKYVYAWAGLWLAAVTFFKVVSLF